jgi:hypothetical protein
VHGNGAAGEHARGLGLAQHPTCKVDIVHAAVHEDATRRFGKADEKARFVILVAGLRTDEKGLAQCAVVDGRLGLYVTGVEAAHKADHGHQTGVFPGDGLHGLAGRHVQRQRLLDEDVFTRAQAG